MERNNLPIIGISIGDFNGVGPEVILKALNSKEILKSCIPVIYASVHLLNHFKKNLNVPEFSFQKIKNVEEANDKQVNLIAVWDNEVKVELGKETKEAGEHAVKSLKAMVQDAKQNKLAAIVTAPINKANAYGADFAFAGHTDYLAAEFNISKSKYAMMLVSENIKVSLLTEHIPLQKVSELLNINGIVEKIETINQALKSDFLIGKPKIALLGLNPHAGDGGLLGKEEQQVLKPAIDKLTEKRIVCFGPYSADGFFGSMMNKKFDCVVASYHDQGLIPFKSMSFNDGVNYTAGLPIIRTSPDHGTAYDIAPKFIADENSFRQAIYVAIDAARNRYNVKNWNKNSLPFSPKETRRNNHFRD